MKLITLIIPIAIALAINPAAAQFSVELRGGATIGNHLPAAAGLETIPGPSLAAAAEYMASSFVSAYAAFSRSSFGCEGGFCTADKATVTTTGYGAGIRVHAARFPWVRAGGIMYDASVEMDGETGTVDSAFGYELATGFTVPVTRALRILPGLFFRTQPGDERTTLVGAEIGLQVSFGR